MADGDKIVRGMLRGTKRDPAAVASQPSGLAKIVADAHDIAQRCGSVADEIERLSLADEALALRLKRLARGFRSISEGLAGEVEDL